MPLVIEQFFPQGRFHATRWRENPFADPFGEWPPSPWRLLRALAARWFQYSRETGDRDEAAVEGILRTLAAERPEYYLPPSALKGTTLKQYQPISEHSWSDPSAGSGAVKRAKTTLFPDGYFVVDPRQPVIWRWLGIDVNNRERDLLTQLLSRITYFGRAESRSRLSLSSRREEPNCLPSLNGGNAPVLCFAEGTDLNFEALRGQSDAEILGSAPVPPGTEWVFYRRPEPSPVRMKTDRQRFEPVNCVQFALGGHVLPAIPMWIKVTERFRGRVLREFTGGPKARQLLSGKADQGYPLHGAHEHAFYLLWPGEDKGTPSRLIVWRRGEPFQKDEVDAMMLAARRPIPWTMEKGGWTVQLVPLPGNTAPPRKFQGACACLGERDAFRAAAQPALPQIERKLRLEEEAENDMWQADRKGLGCSSLCRLKRSTLMLRGSSCMRRRQCGGNVARATIGRRMWGQGTICGSRSRKSFVAR